MLCSFLLYSYVIQLYIYIHSFLSIFFCLPFLAVYKNVFILIGAKLLYNVVMVLAIRQYASLLLSRIVWRFLKKLEVTTILFLLLLFSA